jgi:hypothetical protein
MPGSNNFFAIESDSIGVFLNSNYANLSSLPFQIEFSEDKYIGQIQPHWQSFGCQLLQ